jgi:hypothetical protein
MCVVFMGICAWYSHVINDNVEWWTSTLFGDFIRKKPSISVWVMYNCTTVNWWGRAKWTHRRQKPQTSCYCLLRDHRQCNYMCFRLSFSLSPSLFLVVLYSLPSNNLSDSPTQHHRVKGQTHYKHNTAYTFAIDADAGNSYCCGCWRAPSCAELVTDRCRSRDGISHRAVPVRSRRRPEYRDALRSSSHIGNTRQAFIRDPILFIETRHLHR